MGKAGHVMILLGVALVGIMCMGSSSAAKAGISCATVTQELAPCLGFIIESVEKPSASCCSGAKKIAEMAASQGERQGVCECIKKTTASLNKVNYDRIPQITKICGVKVSLPPITKNTNCKTIPIGSMA